MQVVYAMPALAPEDLMDIFKLSEQKVDCAGIKLTLAEVYSFKTMGSLGNSARKLPEVAEISPRNGVFELPQGAYRAVYSEVVEVPEDCLALAIPRSSLMRCGAIIFTAVWDPGYKGRGEGLLVVFNPHGIELERGVQIAQLVYIKLTRKTKKIYRGQYYLERIQG